MTARVSTEYIDVLGQKNSAVRCTQLYIEVLSNELVVYEQSASDTLAFSDLAEDELVPPGNIEVDASNSLTFVDDVSAMREISQDVSSLLDFEDVASVATAIDVSASSELALDDVTLLIGIWNRESSDSLGVSDGAVGSRVLTLGASSSLTLTDIAVRVREAILSDQIDFNIDAIVEGFKQVSASSVLSLADMALPGIYAASASSVMMLVDAAGLSKNYDELVVDTLSFSDEARQNLLYIQASSLMDLIQTEAIGDLNNEIRRATASMINFTGVVAQPLMEFYRSLPSEIEVLPGNKYLNLVQSVSFTGPKHVSATSTLTLSDMAMRQGGEVNLTASSVLGFADKAGQVKSASASSILAFDQKAERRFYLASAMTLNGIVSGGVSKAAASVINLTDAIIMHGVFNKSVTTDLGINDAVTFFIPRKSNECTYSPFLGSGSSVPATGPTLTSGTLTLTYGMTTLQLRNPEFQNQHVVSNDRINRTTRGGTITVFSDPKWPKQQQLKVQVKGLDNLQVRGFLSFLTESLGQQITLADWEGRTWVGIITTPDAGITRDRGCKNALSFEFEGELQ
jgi:hypothetical protein